MLRLTFKQQVIFGFILMGICFVLSHFFQNGVFHNVAWIVYGVAFIVNPVWPQSWSYADSSKMKRGARIAGIICILIGLLTRFGV